MNVYPSALHPYVSCTYLSQLQLHQINLWQQTQGESEFVGVILLRIKLCLMAVTHSTKTFLQWAIFTLALNL